MKLSTRAAVDVLKDSSVERLVSSIDEFRAATASGPGAARRVLARFRLAAKPALPTTGLQRNASPLTARETEILRLTAKGLAFDKVGEVLEISPHTVGAHMKRIYLKLAVHSRGEAVFEAGQLELL